MATSISTLISTCPSSISTSSGVADGITWLATCATFAETQDVAQLPNKSMIKSYAYAYWESIKSDTTDYADVNNKVLHIKYLLSADNTVLST